MHHGVNSSWHSLTQKEAYETVASLWLELDFEYVVDTYHDRQLYRNQLASQKKPTLPIVTNNKRYREEVHDATDVNDGASEIPSEAGQQICPEAVQDIVRLTVKQLKTEDGSPSSSLWSDVGRPRSCTHPPLHTHPLRQLTAGAPVILQQGEIPIPEQRLLMLQESLQRAEHAISQNLQVTVALSKKLVSEREIVKHAIGVVSKFSGVPCNHFNEPVSYTHLPLPTTPYV